MDGANSGFNLVDEAWIRVRMRDGDLKELSIRETFAQALAIESLRNDNAAQDFAILRLLLAVLQRSLVPVIEEFEEDDETNEGLAPAELWGRLWTANSLPLDLIDRYLAIWQDRFDLFDFEKPFMQVSNLETQNGEAGEAMKIVADVPDGYQFFTVRQSGRRSSLPYSEAARWLVHAQAFDTAGIKSGVVGDPNAKRGKSYSLGVPAWCGTLGCLYLEGANLSETLLLNLVLWGDDSGECFDLEDKPVWERSLCGPGGVNREPTGRMDLYTWQSRRIRLCRDVDDVVNIILTNGDKLDPAGRERTEPMSGWKRSANQEKKLQRTIVYMPAIHHPDKALWRGLQSVLPSAANLSHEDTYHVPEIVEWVAHLMGPNGGYRLPTDMIVRLHAVGYEYGTQNSSYVQLIDDCLSISTDLLSPDNSTVIALVEHCLTNSEESVKALGYMASNVSLAAGSGQALAKGAQDQAKATAYFELDSLFRKWLLGLAANVDVDKEQRVWNEEARSILSTISASIIEGAGVDSFVGREVEMGKKTLWINTSKAESIFKHKLQSFLPVDDRKPSEGEE